MSEDGHEYLEDLDASHPVIVPKPTLEGILYFIKEVEKNRHSERKVISRWMQRVEQKLDNVKEEINDKLDGEKGLLTRTVLLERSQHELQRSAGSTGKFWQSVLIVIIAMGGSVVSGLIVAGLNHAAK